MFMLKWPVFWGDSRREAAPDEFVMIVSEGGTGVALGEELVDRSAMML